MSNVDDFLKDVAEEDRRRATTTVPPGTASSTDVARRKRLKELADFTGRPLLVYASAWTDPSSPKASTDVSIHPGDKFGFEEVTRSLPNGPLDVMVSSPGGSAEATEGIVRLLRSRFTDIRFIIPQVAKSAATMLAMSGSSVVMGAASELGPIDPQRQWRRNLPGGASEVVYAPVWAIEKTWERIDEEVRKDPSSLPRWYPIIATYGPSLLMECQAASQLAKDLVTAWLADGMFAGEPDAAATATAIATKLADPDTWLSHSRMISIDHIIEMGVKVVDLRRPENSELNDHVWRAWSGVTLTLGNTDAAKIFENHLGEAYVTNVQMVIAGPRPSSGAPPGTRPPQLPSMNREQRRAANRR